jgi:hypothetical protein
MSLLKDDQSIKPRPATPMTVIRWPTDRWPEGLGMSVRDGWNWGIGFGLAMAIAVPIILLGLACIIGLGITILGGSLGALCYENHDQARDSYFTVGFNGYYC